MYIPLIDLRTIRHPPVLERLVTKIQEPFDAHNDCWIWIGRMDRNGYGRICVKNTLKLAHRVSHELFNGAIPSGYDIDHLCKNKKCVNPDHLKSLPKHEHYGQAHRERTHCLAGHLLEGSNVHYRREGWRQCRICSRRRDATRRYKRKLYRLTER
jgi:hypothetical protein